MKITIVTNNHVNTFIYGYELPENIKKDFDYLDDIDSANFIKYRDRYYDLSKFMRVEHDPDFKGWDRYTSDSFFSGVLIKFVNDDSYKIATYESGT